MSRKELLGKLPVYQSGPNKGRLDRNQTAKLVNLSKRQLSKAYNNWIQIFRIPESTLTFEQYLNKLREANITPDDVGNLIYQYHLARIGDIGPYANDTCRFILKKDNLQEQYINGKRSNIFDRTILKYGHDKAIEIQKCNGLLGGKAPRLK